MGVKSGRGICTEIRKEDGAQRIAYGPDLREVEWLMGPDRVQGLKVGATGELQYMSHPNRGWWDFKVDAKGATYRDYHISYDPPPIPWRGGDWQFAHDGYDGPGDNRCGFAGDLEEALERIDELEDDR